MYGAQDLVARQRVQSVDALIRASVRAWLNGSRWRRAQGQSLVQLALALPVFLFVVTGMFQFLLTLHVQSVSLGAAENGAALAASRGVPAVVGQQRATELMLAGLGGLGRRAQVTAGESGGVVTVDVTLQLAALVPLTDRLGMTTVHARGRATREVFRPGGGGSP